ncbi:MAG: DUF935 family protein, partial [Pikeienuella sp.]
PKIAIPVEEPEDVKALVEAMTALADRGLTFRAADIRSKLGLTAPEGDDEVFGGVRPSAAPAAQPVLNRALNAARTDPYAPLDEIEGETMEGWEEITAPVLGPLEAMLREAGSYEEALARLPELSGEMDASEMIGQLVAATFRARARGDEGDG